MDQLEQMFADGSVVNLIIAFMAIEAVALLGWSYVTGNGLAAREVAVLLIPGLCLMLALRASLINAPWTHIAGFLLASLIAHLADIWLRWPRR